MQPGIFIGIDLGTSGCRIYAIDENKHILASSNQSGEASVIKNNHVTQDPSHWWLNCQQALNDVLTKIDRTAVKSISIDGTSGTVLLCETDGKAISPAYMYNDAACTDEALLIRNIAPDTSGAHGTSSGLSKCLNLHKQFNRDDVICLNQADWIAGQFLNQFDTSDENNALKMGYDPVNREWPDWVQQLECFKALPDKILPPGTASGNICAEKAQLFKLPAETKIVAGTTDSIAAFIATGCDNIGEAVTSLGSTLAIKLISERPVFAPEYGVYSHRLGNKWLVGGASNAGGAVLKSYFDDEALQKLSREINPETPTRLDYYPLQSPGERFPINNPNKSPVLTPRPKEDHIFLQGMLEGIADIEKMAFDKLVELGAPDPTRIITMGGGSQNEVWRNIREKMCRIPVSNAEISEAAYGSALLARQAFKQLK